MVALPGVLPLSLGLSSSDDGLYTTTGFRYDYAIGALPFLSAASHQNPIMRQTAPFRKQQFDNSSEPGEQSLDGWWIRSQQSFHGGAGQLYGDPSAGDATFSTVRYCESKGVDPWTPGEVKLLRRTESVAPDPIVGMETDGTQVIGWLDTGELFFVDSAGSYHTEPKPFTETVYSVAVNGTSYYVAAGGHIWHRTIAAGSGALWNDLYNAGATAAKLGWVKERLVYANNVGIYELVSGSPVLPSPNWTAPNGAWTPTGIAESNNSIYVAGVTFGSKSIILQFTLNASGAMPTLTSGAVVATLPQGEEIGEIFCYLGKFLAISTSQGPRIALIGTDGSLELGPLLFTGQTGSWTARGPYLFTPAMMPEWENNEGGICRIDLGQENTTLRFAYASDLYASEAAGAATRVCLTGGVILIGTDDGLYTEVVDEYVDSGWLQTSRIRFGTLEPKVYKLLRSRGPILESDYFVSVIDPNGTETMVVGYVAGQTPGEQDITLGDLGPLDYLSVKFTLFSDAATNMLSAVASGFQVKALPAQPRQRMMQIPLLCFDMERDKLGATTGYEGSALARLTALEDVDEAADTVMFQDLSQGTATEVVIDQMTFAQTSPPDGFGDFGGIITLTLRTV